MMFNLHTIGCNIPSAAADFGDQARHMNQQGYSIAEDIVKSVKLFLEHFPKRSLLHNGLEIDCKGEIDDVQGNITLTMRTLKVAGGL